MMDSKISTEEKIEKIDHFCKQLVNSGFTWEQIREVTVSGLKGIMKKEAKHREEETERKKLRGIELDKSR